LARARDTQKSRLYKAEECLEAFGGRLEKTTEIADFLTKVLNRAPVQARYAPYLSREIAVKDGRGCRIARGGTHHIKLPKWARSKEVALHEVAHTLTTRKFGSEVAAHGREYASVFLDLVRFGLGQEAHDALVASFKTHRVKYRSPRGKAKPVHARRVAFKAKAQTKPKVEPTSWDKAWAKQRAQAQRDLRKLAREFEFTFKIVRDGGLAYFETDTFPVTGLPFSTMHYDWFETLNRVEKCIEDPLLIDGDGGYVE
jgi:putative metallohydrolase (TIGR04338 family)